MDFKRFLSWESTTRDTIDFKTAYVDLAGDLIAGLLLSQIIYWHLPSSANGESKLRVHRGGKWWLVKGHEDWYEEIRISRKQAIRALGILKEKALIETEIHRFNGLPYTHIHLNQRRFMEAWNEVVEGEGTNESTQRERPFIPKGYERESPKGTNESDQRVRTITETTTEIKKQRLQTTTTGNAAADESSSSLNSLNSQKGRLTHLISELDIEEPTRSELASDPKMTGQLVALWREEYSRWKETGKGFENINNVQAFMVSQLRRGNVPGPRPQSKYDKLPYDDLLREREREAEYGDY